jgi:hypothetical protein
LEAQVAIKLSSVIAHGGVQDARVSGLVFATADPTAVGGIAITQDTGAPVANNKIKRFDGTAAVDTTNPFPWGLLIEPVNPYTGGGVSGDNQAGLGYDSLDYGRGFIYSAAHTPGNLFDVYDDGRNLTQVTVNGSPQNASAPFVVAPTLPWALGLPVYADANGLLDTTVAPSGGARIGWVRGLTGTGADLTIALELDIDLV